MFVPAVRNRLKQFLLWQSSLGQTLTTRPVLSPEGDKRRFGGSEAPWRGLTVAPAEHRARLRCAMSAGSGSDLSAPPLSAVGGCGGWGLNPAKNERGEMFSGSRGCAQSWRRREKGRLGAEFLQHRPAGATRTACGS